MADDTKKKKKGADIPEELRKKLFHRLMGYVFRYRLRILGGTIFSLIAALANLTSITVFIPIFNAIGAESPVEVFQVGGDEVSLHERMNAGEELKFYEWVSSRWASFKIMANEAVKDYTPSRVIFVSAGLILPVYFIKLIAVTISIYFIGTTGLLAVRDLREELYLKMNELGLEYFSSRRTGFIMSRVINDVEQIGKSLSMEFNESLINFFYLVTHLAFLAVVSWKMLLTIFLIAPIMSAPIGRLAKRIRQATHEQQEWLARMGAHIQEILSGIRVIRAFSMERFEDRRFREKNEGLYRNTFQVHYLHQVGPALTEFIATVFMLSFLSWGAYAISQGTLDRGLFFAFFFTFVFIMRPLKQISVMMNLMGSALAASERVFEFIDHPPSIQEKKDARSFTDLREGIEMRNVSFRFPETEDYALSDINIKIKKGMTVSIVGPSGAGKSTLVDLLPRFYDPTEGSVLIDGQDIRELNLRNLRTSTGIVTQSIFLFNASIRDNISYGRDDVPLSRIMEAAIAANAHEFIESFPGGYDSMVGERGVMLSGGQRQRLAIARALLHDPPILIFDEATSSLDNESELLVQQAMDRLREGRTVFVIAHRLSTVYRSDLILVMDRGRIVERGDHRELLEKSGLYKKLYEMQFESP